MSSPSQLVAQIRFHLDQLTTRNGQFEFEHLCRHLARARICSNLVPATGPVVGGGDQGRDFETFRSWLGEDPSAQGRFVGMVSGGAVAFSCTLQRGGLKSKVLGDVTTATESGTTLAGVTAFLGTNMKVALRHELQDRARSEHGVELQILDAEWIAAELSQPEIFWLAVRFLDMPSEAAPSPPRKEDWYEKARRRWSGDDVPHLNYSEFEDVRAAARRATFEDDWKPDLSLWLSALKHFIESVDPAMSELQRRAKYEGVVASLRGRNEFGAWEPYLRELLTDAVATPSLAALSDATTLLGYAMGAQARGIGGFSREDVVGWHKAVAETIDVLLGEERSRCALLELRGSLCVTQAGTTPESIVSGLAEYWGQLVEEVENEPYFPLERFADRLGELVVLFGDPEELQAVTQATDDAVAERFGRFAAADHARTRGLKLYERGLLPQAIRHLHRARIDWSAAETLKGSVLAALLCSHWYRELGLTFAGKYFALAALHAPSRVESVDVGPLIPVAAMEVAECCYAHGAWLDLVGWSEAALILHGSFSAGDLDDVEQHELLEKALLYNTYALAVAAETDESLLETLSATMSRWPLWEVFQEVLPAARANVMTPGNVPTQDRFLGRPFSDLAGARVASWSALGIEWRVTWQNDDETTPFAEQFIAVLQIIIVEVSLTDLHLLPTRIEVRFEMSTDAEPSLVREAPAQGTGAAWSLRWPRARADDGLREHLLTIGLAAQLLADVSLGHHFLAEFERCVEGGLRFSASAVGSYSDLLRLLQPVRPSGGESSAVLTAALPGLPVGRPAHPLLEWRSDPAREYSAERARELLENRYLHAGQNTRITRTGLGGHQGFRQAIALLREEGWLDWQLLGAVSSLAATHRVSAVLGPNWPSSSPSAGRELFTEFFGGAESLGWPEVPSSIFDEDSMRMSMRMNLLSTLNVLGLRTRMNPPDVDAVIEFLRARFRVFEDDVKHDDPFDVVDLND